MKENERATPANPTNPAKELAPLAGLAAGQHLLMRDADGRFLSGNNGGGRPKGSRNRLTDTFLSAIADDFAVSGSDAIAKVREIDPATYLKLVSSLLPRQLVLQHEREGDFSDLTLSQVEDLLRRTRHNRNVQNLIDTAK